MNHQSIFFALCFFVQASLCHGAVGETDPTIEHGYKEEGQGNLFPGESITYRDVTLSWEIAGSPGRVTDSLGFIRITSARPEIADQTMEVILNPEKKAWERHVHFDSAALLIRGGHWQINDDAPITIQQMLVVMWHQPRDQFFDACPTKNVRLFVSAHTPIQLNEWEVQLSDSPVSYPDGNDYLEITFENTVTGSTGTLPAVSGVSRKFGRFAVGITDVFEVERIARLMVKADVDTAARGGDCCVSEEIKTFQNLTLEGFLNELSERYGFEVEWVEHPGHPESIEDIKGLSLWNSRSRRGILKKAISELVGNLDISLEWVDATHLRVSPVGYEKIVEKQEEERQKQEAANLQEELLAEKNQEALEEFEAKFSPVTRIYQLEKITPVTAKALIDRELRAYGFLKYNSLSSLEDPSYNTLLDFGNPEGVDQQGIRDYSPFTIEQCVADEKANAVIVTAIPETHEKVKKLLMEMDGMLAEREQKAPPRQYRLGVVLLQGVEAGNDAKMAEPTMTSTPSPLERANEPTHKGLDTEIDALNFENQDIRELVNMLAQFSETSINVAGSIPSKMPVTLNIHQPRPVREVLEDLAKIYDLWVDYQPGNTIIRPARERNQRDDTSSGLAPFEKYGIAKEDLEMFGFTSAKELGKGMVLVAGEKGDEGSAFVSLTESYACEFQFLDFREPYLILKGRMVGRRGERALLENTLYLEPEKPVLLGLTNLREALILVVRLHGEKGE